MPTRLLLEGTDLQELLAQVRDEHGPAAKIISAERVRAGGLTGLLRPERYELTIELPDPEPTDDAEGVRAEPQEDHERVPDGGRPGASSSGGTGDASPFDGLMALLDQREAKNPDSAAVGAFEEVLADISGTRSTRAPHDEPPRAEEPTGFTLDPIFAPATRSDQPPPRPTVSSDQAPPAAVGEPPRRVPGPGMAPTAPTARGQTSPTVGRPTALDAYTTFGDVTPTPPAAQTLVGRLAALGVPDHVLRRLPADEAYPAIVRALDAEPPAPVPPAGPGVIIAIVGDLASTAVVTDDLARILRLDPRRTMVASASGAVERHIADPGDAARRAARLRGGDQPRLVAVDSAGVMNGRVEPDDGRKAPDDGRKGMASFSRAGTAATAWAAQVLAALRPDTVWYAVDATRKTADVARQLAELPRVDALAVHALGYTADPASPLALGLPVALLDGQPADPHVWAALLCRRLYELEHPHVDH